MCLFVLFTGVLLVQAFYQISCRHIQNDQPKETVSNENFGLELQNLLLPLFQTNNEENVGNVLKIIPYADNKLLNANKETPMTIILTTNLPKTGINKGKQDVVIAVQALKSFEEPLPNIEPRNAKKKHYQAEHELEKDVKNPKSPKDKKKIHKQNLKKKQQKPKHFKMNREHPKTTKQPVHPVIMEQPSREEEPSTPFEVTAEVIGLAKDTLQQYALINNPDTAENADSIESPNTHHIISEELPEEHSGGTEDELSTVVITEPWSQSAFIEKKSTDEEPATLEIISGVTSGVSTEVTAELISELTSEDTLEIISEEISEDTSDFTPEIVSEATTKVTSQVIPEVTSGITSEVSTEATAEVILDVISEITSEVTSEVGVGLRTAVASEVTSEDTSEFTSDVVSEASSKLAPEVTSKIISGVTSKVSPKIRMAVTSEPTSELTTEATFEVTSEVTSDDRSEVPFEVISKDTSEEPLEATLDVTPEVTSEVISEEMFEVPSMESKEATSEITVEVITDRSSTVEIVGETSEEKLSITKADAVIKKSAVKGKKRRQKLKPFSTEEPTVEKPVTSEDFVEQIEFIDGSLLEKNILENNDLIRKQLEEEVVVDRIGEETGESYAEELLNIDSISDYNTYENLIPEPAILPDLGTSNIFNNLPQNSDINPLMNDQNDGPWDSGAKTEPLLIVIPNLAKNICPDQEKHTVSEEKILRVEDIPNTLLNQDSDVLNLSQDNFNGVISRYGSVEIVNDDNPDITSDQDYYVGPGQQRYNQETFKQIARKRITNIDDTESEAPKGIVKYYNLSFKFNRK